MKSHKNIPLHKVIKWYKKYRKSDQKRC